MCIWTLLSIVVLAVLGLGGSSSLSGLLSGLLGTTTN
jgi:hypothetical protein